MKTITQLPQRLRAFASQHPWRVAAIAAYLLVVGICAAQVHTRVGTWATLTVASALALAFVGGRRRGHSPDTSLRVAHEKLLAERDRLAERLAAEQAVVASMRDELSPEQFA